MSQADPHAVPESPPSLPPPRRRRWPRVLGIFGVFVLGVIVGSVGTGLFVRERITSLLKHPEQVPDRVMVILRRKLDLTDEQAQQVEQVVRRRHAAIEAIRGETQPRILVELEQLKAEVAELLTPQQQQQWRAWCETVESRLMPAAPAKPSSTTKPEKPK